MTQTPSTLTTLAKTSDRPQIVVLGAGYAGVLAALRLAGRTAKHAPRIVLVNDRPAFVERIRLHQLAAGQTLPRRPIERLLRGTTVELAVGRVTRVSTEHRTVALDVDGEPHALPYDILVCALGSGAPRAVAIGHEHGFGIENLGAAERLAAKLRSLPAGATVVVVGGGLTGIEATTEIAESRPDLSVRLVAGEGVAPGLSAGARDYVRATLRELGVDVLEHERVAAIAPDSIGLASGVELPSSATVWCGGFGAPTSTDDLGIGRSQRLLLDETLRSVDHSNIFGAGDGGTFQADELAHLRMACATAMPLGAHAADNVARMLDGRPLVPFGFAFYAQCISLGRRRAVVQRVSPHDAPKGTFLTGWWAARLKEAICRYTIGALTLERLLPGTYTWPGRTRPLQARRIPSPHLS